MKSDITFKRITFSCSLRDGMIVNIPIDKMIPWRLVNNETKKVAAYLIFNGSWFGFNSQFRTIEDKVAASFPVTEQEYNRLLAIYKQFEANPKSFIDEKETVNETSNL